MLDLGQYFWLNRPTSGFRYLGLRPPVRPKIDTDWKIESKWGLLQFICWWMGSLRKNLSLCMCVFVCAHKCVWVCGILRNVVSRVMIVQETGVLKPYVLMPHAAAIFSWLRSGVTCAAGIVESYAGQFILSAVKIPFLENRVTCKTWVEYEFISCRCVSFSKYLITE